MPFMCDLLTCIEGRTTFRRDKSVDEQVDDQRILVAFTESLSQEEA